MIQCLIIWTKCVQTACHPNSTELHCAFVLLHRGPSCTAVKLQHAPSSPNQKKRETQGSLFSVDTLDINSRLIVKEKCEDRSEVKKTETVRASELHAHRAWACITAEFTLAALTDVSTERRSALQWLLTKQLFDRPLFWQHSLLSKNSTSSFSSFCGEVDLFLQCPSPCLVFPSGFLWFLRQRVFGLQLPDTSIALSERPVCLLYLWNSEKQAGPAGPRHQIYITWEVQGEFRPRQACSNISTLKNIWLFTSRRVITAQFMAPS